MLAVVRTAPGVVEVNYMWLPAWIGMNSALLREVEAHVRDRAVGQALTDETLQWLHHEVVSFLCARFPVISGLESYLNGLMSVGAVDAQEDQG
jgi:hypothetical protein